MDGTFEGYTRVTDVLDPFSGLSHVNKDVVKAAAERGTRVHKLIDAHIGAIGTPVVDEDIKGYYESFLKLPERDYIDKPKRFFDHDLMLTGECDAIYVDDEGKQVLVDFKTPAKEKKSWPLQGSAYSYLANKAGYKISRIEFVKLCKNGGEPEVFTYQENFALYLHCLDVYRYFFKEPEESSALEYI